MTQTYFNYFDNPIAWHGDSIVRVWRYNADRTQATVIYLVSNTVMTVPVADLHFPKVKAPNWVGTAPTY